jgi:fatty-acyl-CoA synthase
MEDGHNARDATLRSNAGLEDKDPLRKKEEREMKMIHRTIHQVIEDISQNWPNREALVHTEMGVRYSYALLSWEAERMCRGLLALGLDKGNAIAIWAPNIPEWIVSFLAISKMGGMSVPIDPAAPRDDLHYILDQSECRGLIMGKGIEVEESLDLILAERDRVPSLEHVVAIADQSYPETIPWTELTAMGDDVSPDALKEVSMGVRPEDPVAIMYTSGTTGKPKGVVLDHLGLINKPMVAAQRQGLTSQDRLGLFFPLFHMFGNTCVALSGLMIGATLVMPCEVFDPSRILHAVFKEQCTAVYGSPSMFIGLLDHPEFNKRKWRTVKKGIVGGAPCPMQLMKRMVEDNEMSDMAVAYGITEASSWITMTEPDDPIDLRVSTIGTPLSCCEVKIIEPATGEELPRQTQGEICTKGYLMKEYYKLPAATAAAIDRDGWLHTGDLGIMDSTGYLRITGRLKDVIVRKGIEIHPVEVEEMIYRFPGVSEAQVFGFPHHKRGQEVAAWIKLKPGAHVSFQDISEHVRGLVGVERTPDHFKVVSAFPTTRSGKVQKYKLAEMAVKEYS